MLIHCKSKTPQDGIVANGGASGSNSKKTFTSIDDVLKGLVDWLCAQVCFQLSVFYSQGGLNIIGDPKQNH